MNCHSQCHGIEQEFNPKLARRELRRYQAEGPRETTRLLIEAIRARGIRGATLLDIGGGVGAIQHELLGAGLERAVSVDASRAYMATTRQEAERRGHADRLEQHFGDFVELAPTIEAADIVTLDRVICCYDEMESLVNLSAERARRLYGLVYPRESWWLRTGVPLLNQLFRLKRSDFRVYLHPAVAVQGILQRLGFTPAVHHETLAWRVALYQR